MPVKLKFFFWRLLCNICLTLESLFKRGAAISPMCLRCGQQETVEHCFFECESSKIIWRLSSLGLDFNVGQKISFQLWEGAENWFNAVSDPDINIHCIIILWNIWLARNQMVWNNFQLHPQTVIKQVYRMHDAIRPAFQNHHDF